MSATEFPLVMKGICEENLEDLRTLNRALFPINYTERVYADILACGDVSQLAYDAEGHLVGGIGCRLENTPQGPMLYVLTLGVLAPYRGHGIGRRLLRATLEVVRECLPEVTYSRLHVQVGNETALRLYQSEGFQTGPVVPQYYPRLTPPDAIILEKELAVASAA